MKFLRIFILLTILASAVSAEKRPAATPAFLDIGKVINAINLVMVHDVVSAPVAARYYTYAMLGAYNLVAQHNKQMVPPAAFIRQFPAAQLQPIVKDYNYRLAAMFCIFETAKTMLPSGSMLQDDEDEYIKLLTKNKFSAAVISNSLNAAKESAAQIVNFSKGDHYNLLSAKLRYTPKKGDQYWYPTPPGYFEAVEPNWRIIRPMMIDSCTQFKPVEPVAFSKEAGSPFFNLAKAVYDTSKNPTADQLHQAAFWDCNPFAITTSGHMMIGFKKISPGGHWMNIACLAVKKMNLSFDQSAMVVTLEAVTLMDSFIGCWDEKYRSERVRPETFINKYIDIKWKPFLQTPPFPEYTSGHAVISNASASLLTYLLGDHFAYLDDTEIPFGVESRSFTSFNQAAEDASMSRFYGGIHFTDSILEGNKQGRNVAQNIIAKLQKAGIKPIKS